jgi:CBS domain-containing protein
VSTASDTSTTKASPPRLRVRDIMGPASPVLREDVPLRSAALVLLEYGVGGAPVVDDGGALVGMLSGSDLLAREAAPRERRGPSAREEARQRRARTVGEACARPAIVTHPDTSAREAARLLLDSDVSRLAVVEERLVGMVSRADVLQALARPPAEVQQSVDAELARGGAVGVTAVVDDDGVAVLSGQVKRRSDAREARRLVAAVDGVIGVEGTPSWDFDDLDESDVPPRGDR